MYGTSVSSNRLIVKRFDHAFQSGLNAGECYEATWRIGGHRGIGSMGQLSVARRRSLELRQSSDALAEWRTWRRAPRPWGVNRLDPDAPLEQQSKILTTTPCRHR